MANAIVPVVVVGAGVSGLTCARELRAAGEDVVVLDRARGVGGRCASRRVDGQVVDFGIAFLHGSDRGFLASLDEVPARQLRGWPREILGSGRPCQPEAFRPGETRLAFQEGVSAFPRHLSRGLDVRLLARVVAIEPAASSVRLRLEDGTAVEASTLVLALASEQAQQLLGTITSPPAAVRATSALLEMSRSHACLSLIAVYPATTPAPDWHASYPEASSVLQLAVHDSSKRANPPSLAMVYQAHSAWSREHLTDAAWPELLLAEAARLFGAWAGHPAATHPHRWTYARTDPTAELTGPMLLQLDAGGRVGLCGDRFAPGAGVQAAWISGTQLARRILEER